MPSTAAARIAASSSRVSLLESVKSLSKAKCRCASRLARNCTSRFSSASSHRFDAAEEGGDHHRRAVLGRHAVLVEVELGERPRREEGGDQLVHHVHRDVVGQEEANQQHPGPDRACRGPAEPEHGGQSEDGGEERRRRRTRRWDGAAPSGQLSRRAPDGTRSARSSSARPSSTR